MELGNYAKLDWIQMYKYSISNKVVTKCTVSNHYDAIFQVKTTEESHSSVVMKVKISIIDFMALASIMVITTIVLNC